MSRYAGQDLFSSGPHRFTPGGLTLVHETAHIPGEAGVRLTAVGQSARAIIQQGTLLADSLPELRQKMAAIESLLDGQSHPLLDDREQTFSDVVMTAFTPQVIGRIGTRWSVEYRIDYLQVSP